MTSRILIIAGILLCAACSQAPLRPGIPTKWWPSPNFDERMPNYVILHHTSNNTAVPALATLTSPVKKVSAHYLIERDGTLFQLVDERRRAWHAGESRWGSDTDLNSSSIGIELDNNGAEPYADAQIEVLLSLLSDLQRRYKIPAENILGHADIAPARKVDPGRLFPWKTLAAHGFGLWCDVSEQGSMAAPPAAFDALQALQSVGYDIADPQAAIRAFKLHFVQEDVAPELNARDRNVLACVLQKRKSGYRVPQ
jgi:N-acetylmuramoyl-L-alanine amidase